MYQYYWQQNRPKARCYQSLAFTPPNTPLVFVANLSYLSIRPFSRKVYPCGQLQISAGLDDVSFGAEASFLVGTLSALDDGELASLWTTH